MELCNVKLGLNYYCQEMVDNCLMGGFANVICQVCGPEVAELVLNGWNSLNIPCVGIDRCSLRRS
jgi:hypothetical protein